MSDITLTIGHIARHTPRGAGAQGRDAATVDVAQDLLLRALSEMDVLEPLAFKGGTALRKLYAGNAGRFSLDLDFSSVTIGIDPDDALADLSRPPQPTAVAAAGALRILADLPGGRLANIGLY